MTDHNPEDVVERIAKWFLADDLGPDKSLSPSSRWLEQPLRERDRYKAIARSILDVAALQPGDRLPNGNVVEQDWQPIETAPKDGTEIIIWAEDVRSRVGYFDSEFNDQPDGNRPYGGWWSLTGEISPAFPAWRDLEEVAAINEPTKWRPLPEPPHD